MNLTEYITPGGPLLEVLRRAEASLQNKPYAFFDWTQCTCGHVYAASTGEWAMVTETVTQSNDVTFLRVVRYIVEATGGLPRHDDDGLKPMDVLSERTDAYAVAKEGNTNERRRAAALQLIRTAIATCEAEQLAAMHAVADEAQRVVSLVDVPESALA